MLTWLLVAGTLVQPSRRWISLAASTYRQGARVPAGDGVTAQQRLAIEEIVTAAESLCGLSFKVYVGKLDDRREGAEALLHNSSGDASRTVLTAIDPTSRALEIVTGSHAAKVVDDRTCALAALAMTSSFQAGELIGGIRNGINLMAEHARLPERRHLDTI